jgi:8-oxo-dGTP diphosphatase
VKSIEEIDWTSWTGELATLLFVVRDGQVLLIRKKRGLGAGKVNAPGGRVEGDETPEACAVREVEEELLVTPTGLTHHGEHRFQFVDGYRLHVHVYSATGCVGEAGETDEAIPLWTATDAIPYDEMWADDRMWIPTLLKGGRFDGRWIFDGDAIVDYVLTLD